MKKRILLISDDSYALSFAKNLDSIKYELIIISQKIESLENLDALVLKEKANLESLKKAFKQEIDLVLIFDKNEYFNLYIAQLISYYFECHKKLVRVNSKEQGLNLNEAFSHLRVNFICLEDIIADAIYKSIKFPFFKVFESFFNEEINIIKIKNIKEFFNTPVEYLESYLALENLSVLGIVKNDKFILKSQKLILENKDEIIIAFNSKTKDKVLAKLNFNKTEGKKILINNLNEITMSVIKKMENDESFDLTLLEKDDKKALNIIENFPSITVLQTSTLDSLLNNLDSSIAHADVFISMDEKIENNIIHAIFARQLNINQIIILSSNKLREELGNIMESFNIIDQSNLSLATIIKKTSSSKIKKLFLLDSENIMFELEVSKKSHLLGYNFKEAAQLIGKCLFLKKNNKITIPQEEDIIEIGDNIIALNNLNKFFKTENKL